MFGIGPNPTPADFHDFRERESDGTLKGFHAESAFWEGVMAHCEFNDGTLMSVSLTPIELGKALPRSDRGIPRLAMRDHGASVVERIADLSRPYRTQIEVDLSGEVATGRIGLA